ncbi:MAG: anaerobic ribonucleoside-triphosphate reductase activating protein [Candidatus Altiarchaeota archaeon]|nr:anaerobic ribonucleoside-triphosphate reductase activating protein [Candidatus Altiarchaeota archaeon]
MPKIEFAGIVDASTMDCCGKGVCAVVYLCGCPFRCPWCHNPELVSATGNCRTSDADDVIHRLRENFLVDAVTLSGGEPLMQECLPALIHKIKNNTGLDVKLDTNGFFSKRLALILPYIDSLSMDIKAPLDERYGKATGREKDWHSVVQNIEESLGLLREWNGMKEARTTVVPGIIETREGIEKIASAVERGGFQRYIIQQFRADRTLDPEYGKLKSPTLQFMRELGDAAKKALPGCKVFVSSAQKGREEVCAK